MKSKRKAFAAFVRELADLKGTSLYKLSDIYGHDRTYFSVTILEGTPKAIKGIIPWLAKHLNKSPEVLINVLNGDEKLFKKVHKKYLLHKALKPGRNPNYIGRIRRSRKMPISTFARKLGVTVNTVEADEKTNLPITTTVVRAAQIFNISPYQLGKKFGYDRSQIDIAMQILDPDSIFHYLIKLRRDRHLSQKDLANELKLSKRAISTMEASREPSMNSIIKLARFYQVSLISFLRKCSKYKTIEAGSPAYHILQICVHRHIYPKDITSETGKNINQIIANKRQAKDHVDVNFARIMINKYNLPNNYFGKAVNRKFEAFKNKHQNLSSHDFGYRLAYLICMSGQTLEQVGKQVGLTRERVRQYVKTRLLNINSKKIDTFAKVFPSEYGDYLHLKDVQEKVIHEGVNLLRNDSHFSINKFIKYIGERCYIRNENVARVLNKRLGKNKFSGSTIATIRKKNSVSIKLSAIFAKMFKIPLITLIRKRVRYRHIESQSPAYKIFKIMADQHIDSIAEFGMHLDISYNKFEELLNNLQNNSDRIHENLANQIIKEYRLPENYFTDMHQLSLFKEGESTRQPIKRNDHAHGAKSSDYAKRRTSRNHSANGSNQSSSANHKKPHKKFVITPVQSMRQHQRNLNNGIWGEYYTCKRLIHKFKTSNYQIIGKSGIFKVLKAEYSKLFKHIHKDLDDAYGCDYVVKDKNKHITYYIDSKATPDRHDAPFYMSQDEKDLLDKAKSSNGTNVYEIYRVYNINSRPKIWIYRSDTLCNGVNDNNSAFKVTNYQVSPNA